MGRPFMRSRRVRTGQVIRLRMSGRQVGLLPTLSAETLRLLLDVSQVRVKVTRTVEGLPNEFPWPIKRGMEIDVPAWLARSLVSLGVAEFSSPLDLKSFESLLSKELVTSRLTKIPSETFEWFVRERELTGARSDDPLAARRLHLTGRDLIKKRLSKALRYAVLATESEVVEKRLVERLTPPERVVYAQIRLIIDRWVSLLLGEKGEDGEHGGV